MNESQDKKVKHRKKPYEKPEIEQVRLRPEEAVLASCKTAVSAGSLQAQCTALGGCITIAS